MLLNRGRQYIEDSFIAGHVDFIFGGATAFFERAHVHAWRDGYLTAASTPAEQPFGFVFANGQITGDSANVKTYLGRPWRDFAQVTFLNTRMTGRDPAAGWHNWDRPERERTARFSEFGSTGPGASADGAGRVGEAALAPRRRRRSPPRACSADRTAGILRASPAHPSAGKANAAPLPRPPGGRVGRTGDRVGRHPAPAGCLVRQRRVGPHRGQRRAVPASHRRLAKEPRQGAGAHRRRARDARARTGARRLDHRQRRHGHRDAVPGERVRGDARRSIPVVVSRGRRLPARRAVRQRRLAAVLSAAHRLLAPHHVQRRGDDQRAADPRRGGASAAAVRVRRSRRAARAPPTRSRAASA